MKDNLLEASPEEIKKRQENADRAMEQLLEEEMAAGAHDAEPQKKKQAKTANERSRLAAGPKHIAQIFTRGCLLSRT